MVIDCHSLVIRRFEYKAQKINYNDNNKKYKIVMLTDLHGKKFGKDNCRLIKKIDDINPDCIMIAGDMFTAGHESVKESRVAFDFLKKLSGRYTIYYSAGNHELKCKLRTEEFDTLYDDYIQKVKQLGVHYLENEFADIEGTKLRVYGLSLPFEYYIKGRSIRPGKEELDNLLGEKLENLTNILLAHNPEYFEDYALWGADLTLSGHYHGGLMRLPLIGGVISPRYRLFPKYDYGEYTIGDSKMVLGCGLGTHTLPIRIFNPGEIAIIEIVGK